MVLHEYTHESSSKHHYLGGVVPINPFFSLQAHDHHLGVCTRKNNPLVFQQKFTSLSAETAANTKMFAARLVSTQYHV